MAYADSLKQMGDGLKQTTSIRQPQADYLKQMASNKEEHQYNTLN